MKSEALRGIRTMRQVMSSLDVARRQNTRTPNSLSKPWTELRGLEATADRQLGQILQKERRRFAASRTSVQRARERLLRSREKLAATINRNRCLTRLRQELQRSESQSGDPSISREPTAQVPMAQPRDTQQNVRQVELSY